MLACVFNEAFCAGVYGTFTSAGITQPPLFAAILHLSAQAILMKRCAKLHIFKIGCLVGCLNN